MDRVREAQRRVPPLASGVPYVQWAMSSAGHRQVTAEEMEQWLREQAIQAEEASKKMKRRTK